MALIRCVLWGWGGPATMKQRVTAAYSVTRSWNTLYKSPNDYHQLSDQPPPKFPST